MYRFGFAPNTLKVVVQIMASERAKSAVPVQQYLPDSPFRNMLNESMPSKTVIVTKTPYTMTQLSSRVSLIVSLRTRCCSAAIEIMAAAARTFDPELPLM